MTMRELHARITETARRTTRIMVEQKAKELNCSPEQIEKLPAARVFTLSEVQGLMENVAGNLAMTLSSEWKEKR